MSQITLYSKENCAGHSVVIKQDTPDLEDVGFLARAKSLWVSGDPWVVYTQTDYGGTYELFKEGRHSSIPVFADMICSLRVVKGGLSNPEINEATLKEDIPSLTTYGLINTDSSHEVQSRARQSSKEEDYEGGDFRTTVLSDEKSGHYRSSFHRRTSRANTNTFIRSEMFTCTPRFPQPDTF